MSLLSETIRVEELKYFSKKRKEDLANNFSVICVPTESGKLFLYYKKLQADLLRDISVKHNHSKETIYTKFVTQQRLQKEKKPNIEPKSVVRSIPNRLLGEEASKPVPKLDMMESPEELPSNRTLFVLTFDCDLDQNETKTWFGCVGKVRRVFVGKIKNFMKNSSKKMVSIGFVVFKNEDEMYKTFAREFFTKRLLDKINADRVLKRQKALGNDETYYLNILKNYVNLLLGS